MDDLGDFFSPQALRQLGESCNQSDPTSQLEEPLRAGGGFHHHSGPEAFPKRKVSGHVLSTQGYSILDFTKQRRKRAKYDNVGRAKVASVREKGACMRCRLLKIPVSMMMKALAVS